MIAGNYGYSDIGKKARALLPAIKRPGRVVLSYFTGGILVKLLVSSVYFRHFIVLSGCSNVFQLYRLDDNASNENVAFSVVFLYCYGLKQLKVVLKSRFGVSRDTLLGDSFDSK